MQTYSMSNRLYRHVRCTTNAPEVYLCIQDIRANTSKCWFTDPDVAGYELMMNNPNNMLDLLPQPLIYSCNK